jgi:hypothetical protein
MLTAKQIKSIKPKPLTPIGKKKWVLKEDVSSYDSGHEFTEEDYEERFIAKQVFAPELGKYVDKMRRESYSNTELRKLFEI